MKSILKTSVRFSNWRTISSIGYSFGLIILFVGIYAYLYYQTNIIGEIGLSLYKYRGIAIPMMISGFLLVILGFYADKQYASKKKHLEEKEPAENQEKKAS